MNVFKHLQLISIKNRIFNVSVNIFLLNNLKKSRTLADFYIPKLSNDMKIAVHTNNLGGQIWYRSLDPVKKRRPNENILSVCYQDHGNYLLFFGRCGSRDIYFTDI